MTTLTAPTTAQKDRPYQTKCLDDIARSYSTGGQFDMAVVPTGGGKTVVFSKLPKRIKLAPGEQMMVLVHRDELVWQAQEKLQKYNPTLTVDVEKAKYRSDPNADIIVASVQTIGRSRRNKDTKQWEWCDRIAKFDRDKIKVLIVDECHHALGESYTSVLRYFYCFKPEPEFVKPGKYLLGVTATPNRSDSMGLESIFENIVFSKDLREMIDEGWLVDIKAFRIDTSVNLDGIKKDKGDFEIRELERRINTPERNAKVVQEYQKLGEGHKAICFTVDVKHTEDMVLAFREEGILAYGITGSTPTTDRQKIYQMYSEGAVMVLISCAVLTEGFDKPIATVGLMARPTMSSLLYRQMVGRLLRPFPSPEEIAEMMANGITPRWIKPYSIILDFCDLTSRHQLNTVPTLFGMRPEFDMKGKKAVEAIKGMEGYIQQKKLPIGIEDIKSGTELKTLAEKIDLFAKPTIPDEVKKASKFAWSKSGTGYQLVLDTTVYRVREDAVGKWVVTQSVKGVVSELGKVKTREEGFKLADAKVPPMEAFKVNHAAQWRSGKPSEKTLNLYASLYPEKRKIFKDTDTFRSEICKKFTAGEVSDLISQRMPKAAKRWAS